MVGSFIHVGYEDYLTMDFELLADLESNRNIHAIPSETEGR
jgi:hypothetical protein